VPTGGRQPTFAGAQPSPEKKPLAVPAADPRQLFPAWRLSLIELADPFGWHRIEASKLLEVRSKLAQFESMRWHDIFQAAGGQNHEVPRHRICRDARNRLEAIGQADVDFLVSLHLSGRERVWGIMDENVLKLLWWDPNHLICPSHKR